MALTIVPYFGIEITCLSSQFAPFHPPQKKYQASVRCFLINPIATTKPLCDFQQLPKFPRDFCYPPGVGGEVGNEV